MQPPSTTVGMLILMLISYCLPVRPAEDTGKHTLYPMDERNVNYAPLLRDRFPLIRLVTNLPGGFTEVVVESAAAVRAPNGRLDSNERKPAITIIVRFQASAQTRANALDRYSRTSGVEKPQVM